MMTALWAYLAICALLGLYHIVVFGYEDIRGKYDRKFGPNWKSGFSWLLLFFAACPIVNLLYLYIAIRAVLEGIRKTYMQARNAKSV